MDFYSALVSVLFFGLKALIVVIAFLICVIVPLVVIRKLAPLDKAKTSIKVENLKKRYDKYIHQFKQSSMSKKDFKKYLKSQDKKTKRG